MGVAGRVLGGLVAMVIAAGPAFGESLEQRVKQLEEMVLKQGALLEHQQERIEAQDQRIKEQDAELQRRAAEGQPYPPSATVAAEEKKEEKKEEKEATHVTVETGHDGLTVQTDDGAFKFRVGGRLQTDFSYTNNPGVQTGSGVQVRRARLKAEGTMWHVWDYKLEANFDNNGEVSLTDAWLRYTGFNPFSVTVGHQKVPFGQQSLTSSNWQVFQERALPDAFIDNDETGRRRLGIVGQAYGDHWNLAGGFFGEGVDDASPANENYGPALRAVLYPIIGERELLTIGGSIYYRNMKQMPGVDFSTRPEDGIGTRLVNTGTLPNVDQLLMYNAETSTVWGSWHAQAEYTGVNAFRRDMSTHDFFGFYAQTGYFLTGESRNYDPKSAKYKRVIPNSIVGAGGIGAWEIAARYSYIDMISGGVKGGRERDVTAGLNWWATPSILFRLNYVYANADPDSARTLTGQSDHANIIEGRAQIVF